MENNIDYLFYDDNYQHIRE